MAFSVQPCHSKLVRQAGWFLSCSIFKNGTAVSFDNSHAFSVLHNAQRQHALLENFNEQNATSLVGAPAPDCRLSSSHVFNHFWRIVSLSTTPPAFSLRIVTPRAWRTVFETTSYQGNRRWAIYCKICIHKVSAKCLDVHVSTCFQYLLCL